MIKISGFLWLMLVLVLPSGAQDFLDDAGIPGSAYRIYRIDVPRASIGRNNSKSVEKIL
jgi:hypothetical protein